MKTGYRLDLGAGPCSGRGHHVHGVLIRRIGGFGWLIGVFGHVMFPGQAQQ